MILDALFKPVVNKLKTDVGNFLKAKFDELKVQDLDENHEADWDQLVGDFNEAVDGLKQTTAASLRISALLACYYLKFAPKKKDALIAAVPTKQDITLA